MKVGLSTLRVLIADDNQRARTLLATMLEGIGITQIRQVADGGEAFQLLRHWPADLAFVDLNMEPVDGIGFIKLIRTAPGSPEPYLPVILITGAAQLGRIKQARDAGVNEVLVKPVAPQVVVDRLKAVIQSKRRFVRAPTYVGPDRRRKARADFQGPWRREEDAKPPGAGL